MIILGKRRRKFRYAKISFENYLTKILGISQDIAAPRLRINLTKKLRET